MANQTIEIVPAGLAAGELPPELVLRVHVTDRDSITELMIRAGGRDRDEYALTALRIGLLSLKHARGQVDTEAVRREAERLLGDLGHALALHKAELNQTLASSLKEYFDPATGKFSERVE